MVYIGTFYFGCCFLLLLLLRQESLVPLFCRLKNQPDTYKAHPCPQLSNGLFLRLFMCSSTHPSSLPSLHRSVCLSVSFSVYVRSPVCPFFPVSVPSSACHFCLSVSVHQFVRPPVRPSYSPSTHSSVCPLIVFPPVCLPLYLSTFVQPRSFFLQSLRPSFCFVCLSACLFATLNCSLEHPCI